MEKKLQLDLSTFRKRFHSADQSLIWSSAFWTFFWAVATLGLEDQTAKSSAKREACTVLGRAATMSLIKMMKRVGDRTEPCGTPAFSRKNLLSSPLKETAARLSERKAFILFCRACEIERHAELYQKGVRSRW